MIKGLPSKLKVIYAYILLFHLVPPPIALTSFSKLFVFKKEKKETQPKPLHLAGGLGSGEENNLYFIPSIEEYNYI